MNAIAILIVSGLLGVLSSIAYFYFSYRNMNLERNRLASEVDRIENEFLAEFSKLNFAELQETDAGRELLEILKDSDVFPQKIPYEAPASLSLKSVVLNSLQAVQPITRQENIDFHLDIVDPPSMAGDIIHWQEAFNQLISNTVKYTLRRSFSHPNLIRIYGRKGENRYIIILENYGVRLDNDFFDIQNTLHPFGDKTTWYGKSRLIDFIEQQGGKVTLTHRDIDEEESNLGNENTLNQITLYLPMNPKPKGNK